MIEEETNEVVDLHPDEIPVQSYNDIITQNNVLNSPIIIKSIMRGTTISAGSGNSCFKFDQQYGLWLGNTSFASAPFKVNMAGAITATGVTLTGAVTTGAGSVIDGQYLTALSVETGSINNLAITAGKIDNATITATQIANNTITAGQITNSTITTDQIAANTIVAGNIAASTITTSEISGTAGIVGGQIANLTIAAGNITNLTITAAQIANATITGTEVAQNTITGGAAGNIALTSIVAGNIAAATITGNEIAATTIAAGNIAANTITASQIAAGTITATEMTVATLSAITADLGSMTAGSIRLGNAWHIDKLGNMWWGDFDTYDDATIKISAAGVVALTSGVFSGDISAATGKYLESFVAGEDITQGNAVGTTGLFEQTSTAAMLTDDNNPHETAPDIAYGGGTASVIEFYAGQKSYALYKFNLTDLVTRGDSPQYQITSVILHISATVADIPIKLHKITEDWSEDTATWNDMPSIGGTVYYNDTPDVGTNEIDITSLYREDRNGPVYGFAFLPVSGGDTVQTTLRTHEATGEPPYLVISYRKSVSGEVYKSIASDPGSAYGFLGFADETKSDTETIKVATSGVETHQSSLEIGQKYYLSDTAGEISLYPGALYSTSIGFLVGKAISETSLNIYNDMSDAEAVGHKQYYRLSDDTYKANDSPGSTKSESYVKIAEFLLPGNFETQDLRIHFEMANNGATAYGRIHKNGDTFGTERSMTSSSFEAYDEDLLFQPGDSIELWGKSTNDNNTTSFQNFRILGTNVILPDIYNIASY